MKRFFKLAFYSYGGENVMGLISKEQVQKIIAQVCPDNKKGADYLALIYYSAGCLVIYFILFVLSFNLYIQMMQLSK